MKKLPLLFGAILTALTLGAGTASAYPPDPAPLVVSDTTLAPGEAFTATLTGCTVGETVVFEFNGGTTSATCAGAAGAFRLPAAAGEPAASVTLTAPTVPGSYPLVATGQTSGVTGTVVITVVGPTPGPGDGGAPEGELPSTGSDGMPVVQIGAGLAAAGAGLLIVTRQRRRAHSA